MCSWGDPSQGDAAADAVQKRTLVEMNLHNLQQAEAARAEEATKLQMEEAAYGQMIKAEEEKVTLEAEERVKLNESKLDAAQAACAVQIRDLREGIAEKKVRLQK
eukprot:1193642-Prorocentrum_minimum.AAC.3